MLGYIDCICFFQNDLSGGVARLLRHSVLNFVGSTCSGSNHVDDTTNYKPAANSTVHTSEGGK